MCHLTDVKLRVSLYLYYMTIFLLILFTQELNRKGSCSYVSVLFMPLSTGGEST